MSDEDAMAIVNYFASVSKMDNPGIGLESPYYHSPEREETLPPRPDEEVSRSSGKTKVRARTRPSSSNGSTRCSRSGKTCCGASWSTHSRARGAEAAVKAAEEDEMKETDAAKKQEQADSVKVAKATRPPPRRPSRKLRRGWTRRISRPFAEPGKRRKRT